MSDSNKTKVELLKEIKQLKKQLVLKLSDDSQSCFHPVFNKSINPMWVYDMDNHKILEVNEQACSKYGYSREEFLGLTIFDLRPDYEKQRLLEYLQSPRPKLGESMDWKHQYKNGEIIEVEINSHEIMFQGKKMVSVTVNDVTDRNIESRRLIEQQSLIHNSEKVLRLVTSTASHAIIVMNNKGCVTLWNKAAEKMFGFAFNEISSGNLHDFIVPDRYHKKMLEKFLQFIKYGTGGLVNNTIEVYALHKEGHEFPIQISISAFKIDNEWNVTAIIREISEAKRLEKEREIERQKFEAILNSAPDAAIIVNKKSEIILINKATSTLFGYSKEELLGTDFRKLIPDGSAKQHIKNEEEYFSNPKVRSMGSKLNICAKHKTGREIPVEITLSPVEIGGEVFVFSMVRDVTEKKIAEKKLKDSESRFAQFFNFAPIGIAINKMDGTFDQVNVEFTKFTGYTVDELNKLSYWELTPKKYEEQENIQLKSLAKSRLYGPYEKEYITKDGKLVPVILQGMLIESDGQDYIWSVVEDLTERKAKEADLNEYKENLESNVKHRTQELEESLEREKELGLLKTSFVSMASHEFRTPLTSISATSDVILRYFDKLSREDIYLRLEKIKQEVTGMTIMLEDILVIGKSDSQKLDYNPALLDIISLIKDIITEYQLSESKSRTIIYDVSSPEIMVKADKKWIKNIVINLLSNALKYSEEDKQIEISIKKDQAGFSFSFRDYGIGISNEDIKLLFEPFHRGGNVGNISGTGLGLTVLQKAIELHKGKIEVDSEIGKGSNFRVTLPII